MGIISFENQYELNRNDIDEVMKVCIKIGNDDFRATGDYYFRLDDIGIFARGIKTFPFSKQDGETLKAETTYSDGVSSDKLIIKAFIKSLKGDAQCEVLMYSHDNDRKEIYNCHFVIDIDFNNLSLLGSKLEIWAVDPEKEAFLFEW